MIKLFVSKPKEDIFAAKPSAKWWQFWKRRSWWPIQALTIERRQGDAIIPESAALSASTAVGRK
jgi:hypothetical protein